MAIRTVSGSFTRPADTTAYASGDLMANSTTAGSVDAVTVRGWGDTQGSGSFIHRVRIRKSGTSVTTCDVRVHLLAADPATVTNGDNGAFSISGSADWRGSFDVSVNQAFTDGACGQLIVSDPVPVRVAGASQTLFCLLEARSAYTPASAEVFTISFDTSDQV
jgi:hypothetical protein